MKKIKRNSLLISMWVFVASFIVAFVLAAVPGLENAAVGLMFFSVASLIFFIVYGLKD